MKTLLPEDKTDMNQTSFPRDAGNDRIMRLYLIDRFLCDSSTGRTASEIVSYLNSTGRVKRVTKRTVYNDLAFLEYFPDTRVSLIYDAPDPKGARRYRMERGGGLFRRAFRENEIHLLREMLDTIGSFGGYDLFGDGSELKPIYEMARLTAKTRKIVDLGITPPDDPALFRRVYKIIADRNIIELRYLPSAHPSPSVKPDKRPVTSLNHAEIISVTFHPYLLRHTAGDWVIFGLVKDTGKIISVPLQDIVEIIPLLRTKEGFPSLKLQYPLSEAEGILP